MERTIKLVRPIARGMFGCVVQVKPSWTSEECAVKIITMQNGEEIDEENVWLRAMRLGVVPNTIHSYGAVLVRYEELPEDFKEFILHNGGWTDAAALATAEIRQRSQAIAAMQRYLLIFMPLVNGHTMRSNLGGRLAGGLTREAMRIWTLQLTEFSYNAYKYFGMTHNDLKLGNIIMEVKKRMDQPIEQLRVIDFTFALRPSCDYNEVTWSRGTLCYMAPEKLFFYGMAPPAYCNGSTSDRASSDVWSLGTLLSTMALVGKTVFLNRNEEEKRESSQLSMNGSSFCVTKTDSLFHLLPETRPWLAHIVNDMKNEATFPIVDQEQLLQPIRLLLWTRALHYPNEAYPVRASYTLPGDAYLNGISKSPLFALLQKFTPRILLAYDKHGGALFEWIRTVLLNSLGDYLFGVYVKTQTWKPAARYQVTGNETNPFQLLCVALNQQMLPMDYPQLECADSGIDKTIHRSLSAFLNAYATAACCICNAPCSSHTPACPHCYRSYVCSVDCRSRVKYMHSCERVFECIGRGDY